MVGAAPTCHGRAGPARAAEVVSGKAIAAISCHLTPPAYQPIRQKPRSARRSLPCHFFRDEASLYHKGSYIRDN